MESLKELLETINRRVERAETGVALAIENKEEKDLEWWTIRKGHLVFMQKELEEIISMGGYY